MQVFSLPMNVVIKLSAFTLVCFACMDLKSAANCSVAKSVLTLKIKTNSFLKKSNLHGPIYQIYTFGEDLITYHKFIKYWTTFRSKRIIRHPAVALKAVSCWAILVGCINSSAHLVVDLKFRHHASRLSKRKLFCAPKIFAGKFCARKGHKKL